MTDTLMGASTWEDALFRQIRAHVEAEAGVEQEYESLAETVDAPDVRYLINLILDDEKRHHRLLGQLAEAVRSFVEADRAPDVPAITRLEQPDALVAATKRFLAVEKEDARALRHLLRELQPVEDTTLWSLLVRLMLLDTEKHIEILRFVRKRAKL